MSRKQKNRGGSRKASSRDRAKRRPGETRATSEKAGPSSRYLVSPLYDWFFFLLPPMMALAIGILISGTEFADAEWEFHDQSVTSSGVMIGIFIQAHLFIVFFRSHGNPGIFKLYPARFLALPPLLFLAAISSNWILIGTSVLVTFWDVYHSALQTFGFARIYDGRHGNNPAASRRLDWWLNQLFYVGPILAGVTMMDHIEDFEEFEDVGAIFFTSIPAFMETYQSYYAWAIIGGGNLFILYYLYAQWKLTKRGYQISPLKVYLLASTGFCSIYTWGFNTWGEAFLIMNLFHALQYFGIVWSTEKKNMMKLFHTDGLRFGKPLALVLFLGVAGAYGYWVEALNTDWTALWAITLVVSIMHFWYDGFIWSVQKRQI